MDKLKRPSVLIVEYNSSDEILLKRELERVGIHDIITFRDLSSTRAYLEGSGEYSDRTQHPLPSVIFLDLLLPDGDAADSIFQWKKLLGPQTLLVVLSGSAREVVDRNVYAKGADTFLTKPITTAELSHLVVMYKPYFPLKLESHGA